MILMIEPLFRAWETLKQDNTFTILMSAGGKLLTKTRAAGFSRHDHLLIFCGRYEGVDQRFLEEERLRALPEVRCICLLSPQGTLSSRSKCVQ